MLPPKTEDDCLRLIRNMEGYYQKALNGFEEDDNFYEGLLDGVVELPEGFDVTIPTTARAIVDEAVDNVEPYDMIVRYAPRNFGKASQEQADNIGRFLKNVWMYWRQTNSDIDILRDFIKNLFKHGKAIFKVTPEWSLWPSLDEVEEGQLYEAGGKEAVKKKADFIAQLRKEHFPLVVRSMSPRHIFEDPTMDSRKLWVIEKYEISIDEVRNRFTEWLPILEMPEPFNYNVKELWSATYTDWNGNEIQGKHWIFVNSALIVEEDNPYHDIPYVIKHSGFGTETYDGKPERKAVGFYTRQVKSMLRAEVRRVTHFDALMQQFAFPIAIIPDTLEDLDFDTSPGAINYVPLELMENSKNIFLQAELPAPEYLQSLNIIQSQIERGTTQRAIRGAGVPGTDSAAQLSMITSQAKLRLEPIKRATEEAVDAVNAIILRTIYEVLNDSVSVFGAEPTGPDKYTVKPEQIKGRYRTRTTFMPNEEQVKERKLVLATDAMAKAKLNPWDALTFAGWENPMEVIARNLAWQMMQEPAVMRAMAKQALEDWGLDAKELEMETLADQTQLQQLAQELQQRLTGGNPQGAPGTPLQGQAPTPPQQQQGNVAAAPPQAAGSPLQTADMGLQVNDARRALSGQATPQ